MRQAILSIQAPSSDLPINPINPAWLDHLDLRRHRILGLDIGTKTIGLALSMPDSQIVTPLVTVKRGATWKADLDALDKALKEYTVHAVVIGLPLNMDGSEGPRVQSTRQTAANLATAKPTWLNAPALIGLWDERLSTAAMTRFMIDEVDASRRKRAEVIDALAAHHILQGAVDYLQNQQGKRSYADQ
jgi:putative Holliday junction resolvase